MREDGFYFVKYNANWTIARWQNIGKFWETGTYDFLSDDDFDEIDERRIVREVE